MGLSDLFVKWEVAAELTRRDVRKLLNRSGSEREQDALVRFLAGRDERPLEGAFASLSPSDQRAFNRPEK